MSLTKIFKDFLPSSNHSASNTTPMDFIQSTRGIVRELLLCLESGNMIGVYSPILGDGLFLLGVIDFTPDSGDGMVVFHQDEATGLKLKRARLKVGEIDTVVPINKKFAALPRSARRSSALL